MEYKTVQLTYIQRNTIIIGLRKSKHKNDPSANVHEITINVGNCGLEFKKLDTSDVENLSCVYDVVDPRKFALIRLKYNV